MELLELLKILQSSQDQTTAESNKEAIVKIITIVNENINAMKYSNFVIFCFLTFVLCCIVILFLDHRKVKKQLAKLIEK